METIRFQDIREQIQQAITPKLNLTNFPGETNGFTLIEGFFLQPLQSELSGNINIGGPTVPMVAIVGNLSGRIYYFALKALLPDINLH